MKRVVTTLFLVCAVAATFCVPSVSHAQTGATNYTGPDAELQLNAHGQSFSQPKAGEPASENCGYFCQWARTIFLLPVSALVFVSGSLMYLTGMSFDYVIEKVVVDFGGFIKQNGFFDGIVKVWEFFRDLGEIVLIFAFIFIAIKTILGVGHNNKQMVIRVIIVALLMNFSLFFVQASLDITNFFAYQFYKNISSLQVSTPNGTQARHVGVTERFATVMGVSSWANLAQTSQNRLEQVASARNSYFTAVLHGFGLIGLYLGAAYVFGYGLFLLVVRAVSLVAVMILSSLAFVVYLIPKVDEYFDKWLEALWKNAVFGPVLVALLWASLVLSEALVRPGGPGRNLVGGGIFTNVDSSAVSDLVNYLFVIGFMFGSIKIARMVGGQSGGLLAWAASKMPGARMLVGGPTGAYVNWRQGKKQEYARKGAYQEYLSAQAQTNAARLAWSKDDKNPQLQKALADARERQEQLKKRLDTAAPIGKLNALLGKAAAGLGAKVNKPDGKKLIDSARGMESEQKKDASKVADDARFAKKQTEEARKQAEATERERQAIVTMAQSQKESADRQIETQKKTLAQLEEQHKDAQQTAKTIADNTNPNAMITINGRTAPKSSFTAEQLRSHDATIKGIDQQIKLSREQLAVAQKQAADAASLPQRKEAERAQVAAERASQAEKVRQENISLLQSVAQMNGVKLDSFGLKEAERMYEMKEPDYNKLKKEFKQSETAAEREARRKAEREEDKAARAASQPPKS